MARLNFRKLALVSRARDSNNNEFARTVVYIDCNEYVHCVNENIFLSGFLNGLDGSREIFSLIIEGIYVVLLFQEQQ